MVAIIAKSVIENGIRLKPGKKARSMKLLHKPAVLMPNACTKQDFIQGFLCKATPEIILVSAGPTDRNS